MNKPLQTCWKCKQSSTDYILLYDLTAKCYKCAYKESQLEKYFVIAVNALFFGYFLYLYYK